MALVGIQNYIAGQTPGSTGGRFDNVTVQNVITAGNIVSSTTGFFARGSSGSPSIAALGDTNTGLFFPAEDSVAITTGGVMSLVIDGFGRYVNDRQIGFMAGIATAADATFNVNTLVLFNTISAPNAFNIGNHFNTASSLFTAPVAGRYWFSFTLYMTNSGSNTQAMQAGIRVNGAFIAFTGGDAYAVCNVTPNSAGGVISMTTSVILNLAANDTVGVAARGQNLRVYQGHCFFTGFLIG